MIEPRIYRAAFVPAVLAVRAGDVLAREPPAPAAAGTCRRCGVRGAERGAHHGRIVAAARDRRAGRPGDREAARLVVDAFRGRGFTVEVDRFERGGDDLVNVVGRRAGSSRRQIVVVAARDATGVPDAAGSAADTAALIELARVFEGRPSEQDARARLRRRLDPRARSAPRAWPSGSAIAGPGRRGDRDVRAGRTGRRERPAVVAWSSDTTSGGHRAPAHGRRVDPPGAGRGGGGRERRRPARTAGVPARASARRARCSTEGYDAVRIAGAASSAASGETQLDDVDEDRLGGLGRAALRTVTALDQGRPPERGPRDPHH